MKLLIITQSVDSENPYLAFFLKWIDLFAEKCESVHVICLEEGKYDLRKNVTVHSLGKEKGPSRMKYVRNFYRYIFSLRHEYDAVFVHMNPVYVVLGGILWKTWGKTISMWYTHRNVDIKLRVAEKLVRVIFTASSESFQLSSNKVIVTGHGIDVRKFAEQQRVKALGSEPIRLLHVGRITPIKNCDVLIEAARILHAKWNKQFDVLFIGDTVTESDRSYLLKLKNNVDAYDLSNVVRFDGSVKQDEVVMNYMAADLALNLVPTGGVDKSVLEAMASGLPVMSSNETFRNYFGQYAEILLFPHRDHAVLADRIMALFGRNDLEQIVEKERDYVTAKADMRELINTIFSRLETLAK